MNTATANHQITRAFVPADSVAIVRELDTFLVLFFPDLDEPIYWRAFKPKNAPDGEERFKPMVGATSRRALLNDAEIVKELRRVNLTRGLYFVPNSGGNCDKDIIGFNSWFAEADNRTIPEQHAALDELPLPPSMRVETLRSVHAYWLAASRLPKASATAWRDVQRGLIARLDGDPVIKNPSRVMRMPGFDHVSYDAETHQLSHHPVKLVECDASRRYTLDEMWECFPSPVEKPKTQPTPNAGHVNTSGEDDLSSKAGLNAAAGRWIVEHGRLNGYDNNYVCKCPAHNGNSDSSLFYNPSTGAIKCTSASATCSYSDILLSIGLPAFPIQPQAYIGSQQGPQRGANGPQGNGGDPQATTGDTAPDAAWNCTDVGNGYRFSRQHGARIRYSYAAAKWYAFDGKRWLEDAGGEVHRRAKQTARNILIEAARTDDESERKAKAKWAIASEANKRQRDMLSQAQCELEVELEAFDSERMLFNVANGTLDLRTGELREHSLADMLTKITPINYDPSAECPLWENFLFRIFGGNEETIRFIQRAAGYTLSGDTSEQCFFIGHGTGANGKSTFLDILRGLTGEYGQQTPTETLMVKKSGGSTSDVARLRGARFVAALETDSGQKLSEALIKQMTGSDTLAARFLYHEYFEFKPQFKLWLAANHRPGIGGTDEAIWRRVKLIPFEVTIAADERDPHMAERLREELPGILAWAVRGCLLWQAQGVGTCPAVERGTSDYRSEMDILADFFSERCVIDKFSMVTAAKLYAEYKLWCAEVGEEAKSQRWLGLRLAERGFEPGRKTDGKLWKGIALSSENTPGR